MKVLRNLVTAVVLLIAAAALKPTSVQAYTDCDGAEMICNGYNGQFIDELLGACGSSGWQRWQCCISGYCPPSQLCCDREEGCGEPPEGCTACSPSGC